MIPQRESLFASIEMTADRKRSGNWTPSQILNGNFGIYPLFWESKKDYTALLWLWIGRYGWIGLFRASHCLLADVARVEPVLCVAACARLHSWGGNQQGCVCLALPQSPARVWDPSHCVFIVWSQSTWSRTGRGKFCIYFALTLVSGMPVPEQIHIQVCSLF